MPVGGRGRGSPPPLTPCPPRTAAPPSPTPADVERERSVQIARWCNTYKAGAEAAVVLAHLVAIEQELRQLSVRAGETE